ncbi:MAG: hypothetical protein J6X94_02510 [Lachnospiraceae bacterium]|nr:hypothetical protein [Lachnospiraceae bacterium]
MLLSLSACKGGEEPQEPVEVPENTEEEYEEIVDPDTGEVVEYYHSELAKTGVYDITDIDLGFGTRDVYVNDAGKTESGVYYVVCENDDYWNHAYYILDLDDKGNLVNTTHLSLPVSLPVSEEEQSEVTEANKETSGIVYEDVNDLFKENKIKPEEVDSIYYEYFNYAGDGTYEAIIRIYTNSYEEASKEYSFNVRWNNEGECTDVLYLPVEYGDGYIDGYVYSPDGRLSVLYDSYTWDDDISGQSVIVFSEDRFDDPETMVVTENKDFSSWTDYLGHFVNVGDKTLAVYDSVDAPYETCVGEIDTDTFEPSNSYVLDQLGSGSLYPMGATDDGQLIFKTNAGLQSCKDGEKAVQFFDTINSDFRNEGCGYFVSLNGTEEFYMSYINTKGERYIAYCKHVPEENVEDCDVVTLASTVLYGNMIDSIVDFNEKNNGFRIVFRDYNIFEKKDDYEYDMKKLYEDMKNGRMADIVFLDPYSNVDIDYLSYSGVLADIGALIDEDPDMSRDDYLTNIFDAISFDGKLYRIMPSFSLYTAYGNSEYISGCENWTVDEFLEYSEGLDPLDSIMLTMYETRLNFLEDMLKYNGYSWIDRDNYSCDFNDINFLRLVGYAAKVPEEIDFEGIHMQNYWNGYEDMYKSGEIRLKLEYMISYKESYYDAYSTCKNEPLYVGFPSPDSQGSVITYTSFYLLNASSPVLDRAWKYAKGFLLSDYQESENVFNFPVLRSAFDKMMEDCKNPFTSVNELGEEYEYMPQYVDENGELTDVPFMTDEQIEQGKDFVMSVDRLAFEDQELNELIINVIYEGFDAGKTPEEIGASVQMAVQEVLDERKAG